MYRTVDCSTWDDPWFADLAAMAKLVFLYLLTSHRSKTKRVEASLRQLAFETGLAQHQVADALIQMRPEVIWTPEACVIEVTNRWRFVPTDRPPLSVWKSLRSTVFERDGYTCRYCGAHGGHLECDHVLPISRGGTNDLANLATACKPCNRSKRAKLVEEWQ